ncbi:hypothetical protein FACS1894184_08390 [Clostridia bacterium]|nr:hypothetical protein FACS1894184_08390 [Clostridia bacterium]
MTFWGSTFPQYLSYSSTKPAYKTPGCEIVHHEIGRSRATLIKKCYHDYIINMKARFAEMFVPNTDKVLRTNDTSFASFLNSTSFSVFY